MTLAEAHYRVAAGLLRSDRPLTLAEVVEATGVRRAACLSALDALEEAADVRCGELIEGDPGPQYAWGELPADDTYTMVVHGWSVPNEPLPYTLHYWEVPLASGGSLSLDAAPTSATAGETGTVDVSWSGLAADTEYLGAVSHNGDTGLMGWTFINVDTH